MIVSIVIPVYNSQDTIKKALNSALNQDFSKKNFEIIVVNDGSTDDTLGILQTYGKKIKIINQRNQGAVKAANKGFKIARGKYVIKLDSDDYFEPGILRKMAAILDRNPKINFVCCDYYEKLKTGKVRIVSTKNIFNILACGVMYRKQKLRKEGFYREDLKLPEYDLLLKTQKKWEGYHIPEPLYHFNRRWESLSGKTKWVEEALSELKKIYPAKEIQKIRKF